MLDWELVAKRLVHKGLTKDQAWSAIGRTYITISEQNVTAVNDAQLAEYAYKTALWWHLCWITRPTQIETAVAEKWRHLSDAKRTYDDDVSEDELFVAPSEPQSDADYIAEILRMVPQAMRIPTLCVIQDLLKRPISKPLSVESCRKILQKAGIKNTSEFARQVYTFLTTLRRDI